MEYSVQNLSKSKVEIAIDVNKEEWAADVKQAYEKNKHKYAIDGFRKGKVPMNVLVKRYGIEFFYEEAIDATLSKHYADIIKNVGYDWADFFIFAASGTSDFFYSGFKRGIDTMKANGDMFRYADNKSLLP